MYVIVHHQIVNPPVAFARGEKLITGEGAPAGVSVLQFFPSTDATTVTCLVEADSVTSIQEYVDTVLGDAAVNTTYQVDASHAFADRPHGLPASPAALAR